MAEHAAQLLADVAAALPLLEESAAADGAMLAAVRAVAQTRRDALGALELKRLAADLRQLKVRLAQLRYDAARAEKRIYRRSGAPSSEARALVRELALIWEGGAEHERAVGYTRAPETRRYSGPFVSFVAEVAKLARFNVSRKDLGYAIERTVRDRNRTTEKKQRQAGG